MAVELHQSIILLFPIFRRVIVQTLFSLNLTIIYISKEYLIGLKTKLLPLRENFFFLAFTEFTEVNHYLMLYALKFSEHAFPEEQFSPANTSGERKQFKEQFISKLEIWCYENLEKSKTIHDSTLEQSRALISRLRSIPLAEG